MSVCISLGVLFAACGSSRGDTPAQSKEGWNSNQAASDEAASDEAFALAHVPTWGMDRINQRMLTPDGLGLPPGLGADVNVYILDTGISYGAPGLQGRIGTIDHKGNGDFVGDSWGQWYGAEDCHGHGTHIAGIIADRILGVATEANLLPIRISNCEGEGEPKNALEAIDWLTTAGKRPAVVLMSLNYGDNQQVREAVDRSSAKGLVYVAASGGTYRDACDTSPGGAGSAITVGSIRGDDVPRERNNWGPCIDVWAPGEDIPSLSLDGEYGAVKSGSSMAAAFVAGAAAVYLSSHPEETPLMVKRAIVDAATPGAVYLRAGSRQRRTSNRLLYVPEDWY